MPTNAENLATALTNLCIDIAAWEFEKPSYAAEGKSVQWTQHMEALLRQLEVLKRAQTILDGPFEIRSRVR